MKLAAILFTGLFTGVVLTSTAASADDRVVTPAPAQTSYQMKDQIIIGRPAKPLAATEVSKLPMKSTLTELRHSFVGRAEQPIANAPF